METDRDADATRRSYDALAPHYVAAFADELEHKPFDRALLQRFAAAVGDEIVCEVGCGPGHVAAYLRSLGVDARGIDFSPGMVAEARRLYPSLPVEEGDMRALGVADGAWAGVVAFYSIIHFTRAEVAGVLAEFARVLRPGGLLLTAVHGGEDVIEADEVLGQPVRLTATRFRREELVGMVRGAGFGIDDALQRSPYSFEGPTDRIYLLARKGGAAPK